VTFTVYGMSGPDHWPLEKLFKQPQLQAAEKISKLRPTGPDVVPPQSYQRGHSRQVYARIDKLTEGQSLIAAKQLMSSPVITVSTRNSIQDALNLFKRFGFRHLPVLGNNQIITGILSDRDALHFLSGMDLPPKKSPSPDLSIVNIMKREVLTASPDTDARYIARLFVERRIGAMPIVDSGTLHGILTRSDILTGIMKHFSLNLWA
jgi:acetoin utilization protein AcuB